MLNIQSCVSLLGVPFVLASQLILLHHFSSGSGRHSHRESGGGASGTMASPFVPVPMPMPKERGLRGGGASKPRRPQRASSLGCVSGSATDSSSSSTSSVSGPRGSRQDRGRSGPEGRGSRSRTPPATHSPAPQARVNGGCLEASVEYSTCPRSASDPEGARPIAPTLLGYEVMEERAKFTVRCLGYTFTHSPIHCFTVSLASVWLVSLLLLHDNQVETLKPSGL